MPRFKLTLEYDGSAFHGWQVQADRPTVQATVEAALDNLTGEAPRVQCCGRTDAGVHALGQVAHVDLAFDRLSKPLAAPKLAEALNAHLKPAPVAVLACAELDESFDARLSARERAYRYRIVNRRAPLTVERGLAWRLAWPLKEGAMAEAAGHLVGKHDFSSFRASLCQAKSPVKTLDSLDVARAGELVTVEARARSFLHNQVRIIVGTLALVGQGKWAPGDVAEALARRERNAAGPTAPPDGLYFLGARYPGDSAD